MISTESEALMRTIFRDDVLSWSKFLLTFINRTNQLVTMVPKVNIFSHYTHSHYVQYFL